MSLTEVSYEPFGDKPLSIEESILRSGYDHGIELEACEVEAISGMIRGTHPSGDSEGLLRFDIVQAVWRRETGREYSDRQIALNGILHALRSPESDD